MSNYNLTDENGHIINGLRADVMRCCMENKNLLEEAGSIYVGTGEKFSIGGEQICKTTSLSTGESGEVLMSKGGDLSYSKITENNFQLNFNKSEDLLSVARICPSFAGDAIPFESCICDFSIDRFTAGIYKRGTITLNFAEGVPSKTFTIKSNDASSHFGFLCLLNYNDSGVYKTFNYGLIYFPDFEDGAYYYFPDIFTKFYGYHYEGCFIKIERVNTTTYRITLSSNYLQRGNTNIVYINEIE